MRPSAEKRLELLESGKDRIDIISWRPFDPPSKEGFECDCEGLIKERAKGDQGYLECPLAKGLTKYKVVCKKCGERLAIFNAERPSLKGKFYNLHYTSWFDKKSWHGCLGMNRNSHTMEVNFECACGNKVIKEPREVEIVTNKGTKKVKDMKRYTEYKILKDTDG